MKIHHHKPYSQTYIINQHQTRMTAINRSVQNLMVAIICAVLVMTAKIEQLPVGHVINKKTKTFINVALHRDHVKCCTHPSVHLSLLLSCASDFLEIEKP